MIPATILRGAAIAAALALSGPARARAGEGHGAAARHEGEATAAAGELPTFDAGTPAALRAAHAGEPFVVVFWSTTCEPCVEELPHWAALARRHPGIPIHLVLVPLSGDGEEDEARRLLDPLGERALRSAVVRDDVPERVFHAVDPAWRGELPAAWLFDAAHRAERRLGRLDASWVESWMKAPLTLDPSPPAPRGRGGA